MSPAAGGPATPPRPRLAVVPRPRPAAPAASPRRALSRWGVPLAVWLLSAAAMAAYLRRGWFPHDEGTLAQAAMRVLHGELPHRDFIDVYTGGLAFVDAAAFRLFGESLLAPRIVLLGVALAWVPAVYAVARRFHAPLAAGALTLAAVLWSVPNYTAAMPSWFNTFLATFGLAALLRHADTRRARWLLAAGACAGVSVLVKIVGLYFLAAGVLALLFFEQTHLPVDRCVAGGDPETASGPATGGSPGWRALLTGGLGAFALALLALVRPRMGGAELFAFVLPGAAVAALVAWNERHAPALPFAVRLRRALALVGPFLLGFALPVALFALPYARAGALRALADGVLVLPFRRLAEAATPPPPLGPTLVAALPLAALLAMTVRSRVRPAIWVAAGIVAAVALATVPASPSTYAWTFLSARTAIVVGVVAGCAWLARGAGRVPPARRAAALAVFATAATCGIVQYPYSAPVYFCYVAPLGVLALAAAFALNPAPARGAGAVALAYAALFAALWVNPGYIYGMGHQWVPHDQTVALRGSMGGGLRVRPAEARDYAILADGLRAHAGGSPWAWAGPDTPELYPLAGMRNPTPNLYEHFADQATFEPSLLRTLQARGVNAIVVNEHPQFSRPLSPGTMAVLAARYPSWRRAGPMVLRWREPRPQPGDPQ